MRENRLWTYANRLVVDEDTHQLALLGLHLATSPRDVLALMTGRELKLPEECTRKCTLVLGRVRDHMPSPPGRSSTPGLELSTLCGLKRSVHPVSAYHIVNLV